MSGPFIANAGYVMMRIVAALVEQVEEQCATDETTKQELRQALETALAGAYRWGMEIDQSNGKTFDHLIADQPD